MEGVQQKAQRSQTRGEVLPGGLPQRQRVISLNFKLIKDKNKMFIITGHCLTRDYCSILQAPSQLPAQVDFL